MKEVDSEITHLLEMLTVLEMPLQIRADSALIHIYKYNRFLNIKTKTVRDIARICICLAHGESGTIRQCGPVKVGVNCEHGL